MKTIIFVCHGNICRSPAAEWLMKKKLIQYNMDEDFYVLSRATSTEEIGNDIYPPMKRELYNQNIPFFEHHAKQITKQDYDDADYIFYMDNSNKRMLDYLINDERKICRIITCFTPEIDYIDDPWYSGQYAEVVNQINKCLEAIIREIRKK